MAYSTKLKSKSKIRRRAVKFNSLAACLRLCLCDANSGLLRLCVRAPLRIRPPSFVSFLPVSDLWPWITTEQCAACRWAWIMYRVMSHVYICIVCYTACTQYVVSERLLSRLCQMYVSLLVTWLSFAPARSCTQDTHVVGKRKVALTAFRA